MGPILAERFTVIAADNRGNGDSSIPANDDYTSEAMASDLKGLLDFLKINETLIFGHDKGCGPTSALAAQYVLFTLPLCDGFMNLSRVDIVRYHQARTMALLDQSPLTQFDSDTATW